MPSVCVQAIVQSMEIALVTARIAESVSGGFDIAPAKRRKRPE
jgi:hypothetical protein